MRKVLSVICLLLLCLELFFVEKLRMETPAITASRIPQQQSVEEAEPTPEAAPAAALRDGAVDRRGGLMYIRSAYENERRLNPCLR